MIRIFIVEDHLVMRRALRAALDGEDGLLICGEAASAEAALEEIEGAAPDVVLIDVSLPGMSGLELTGVLRERHPQLTCLILSGHRERTYMLKALRLGARGYLLKEGNSEELRKAVRLVYEGGTFVSEALR
jgi:DNA-binding NarL/FixJ family response regulator